MAVRRAYAPARPVQRPLVRRWAAGVGAVTTGIGLASGQVAAFGLTWSKSASAGLSSATGAALPLSGAKAFTLGLATATGSALVLSGAKSSGLGLAGGEGSAAAVAWAKSFTLNGTPETEATAWPVEGTIEGTLTVATGAGRAWPVSGAKSTTLGLATGTAAAWPVSESKAGTLGLASAEAIGRVMAASKVRSLGWARATGRVWPVGETPRDITVTWRMLPSPWDAVLAVPKWRMSLEDQDMDRASTEYLSVEFRADVTLDEQPVFLAVLPYGTRPEDDDDPAWTAAAWVGDEGLVREARVLITGGTHGPGLYALYGRVVDSSETPWLGPLSLLVT